MKKRMLCRILVAAAVLGITVGLEGKARAGTILYAYSTTLSQTSGPDIDGLNGAKVEFDTSVDTSATYIDRFNYPAVVMNNSATLTISGASVPVNNTTLALPQLAFYPTFAGLYSDPLGNLLIIFLPTGSLFVPNISSDATVHGSTVNVGDTVNVLDFAPATISGRVWYTNSGETFDQINTTITATLAGPSDVPEIDPGSALSALALLRCGVSILNGRRRKLIAA